MDQKDVTMKESEKVPNPREKSNLLKVLTLTWTLGIFKIGRKRALEESDIFEPLKEHASANLGEKFSDAWNEMCNKDNPKLYKLFLTYFRWEILLFFSIALVRECVVSVSQPLLLGNFMSYYERTDDEDYPFPLLPALALVSFYLLYALMAHPCVMAVFHLGLKCRVACCSLIYRKSLKISKSSFGETSVGQIVNLLSNDIGKFDNGISLLSYLIISPMQALIMTYFIWREIGMSAIIGVLVLVLMIPFQMWIAKIISTLRRQTANLTDKRVQLTNEVISGVQVIKMYAWEERFNQLVVSARNEEIDKIRKKAFWRGITNSVRIFNTRLCMAISMVAYVLLGNQISARKLFITASFYEILKRSMSHWFPEAIIQLEEMIPTLDRIEVFLFRKEHGRTALSSTTDMKISKKSQDDAEVCTPLIFTGDTNGDIKATKSNDMIMHETKIESNGVEENALVINDVSSKWIPDQSEYTLRNITLDIPKGSFVAICGPVGSGKSSLLYAILKELPYSGDINIYGKLSYASQEPWLFAGTIKQNIVFGASLNEDRYRRVCEECSLEEDFSSFPAGDLTSIGERGIILSGGQKARVSLARAVYAEADIYLLDDPLSAVDARVGRQLLHGCIGGMLRDKTVLLVTHQMQCLRRADLIVRLKAGAVESILNSDLHLESNLDVNEDENWGEEDHLEDSKRSPEKIVVPKEKITTNENKEKQAKGTVNWKVYTGYVFASGSKVIILTLLVLAVFNQFLASGFDYWNKYWVKVEKNKYFNMLNATMENTSTSDTDNSHNISSISETELTTNRLNLIGIYSGILLALVIVTLCVSDLFFSMTVRASKTYHNKMLRSITRAKMSFFHANPSGRILNRLSQDVGSMDEWLPIIILDVFQFFLQSIGIVSIITMVNYYIPLVLIVMMFAIEHMRTFYIKTSRSVKRLEGITRSPVFSHLSATIQGVVTIRSMGAQEHVLREFDKRQDPYTSATYMFLGIARAFSYWLDLVCFIFSATVTLSFLWMSGNTPEGIGLAVSQVIGLTTMFQMGIRQTTALENQMIGVERVQEYIDLDREPPLITNKDKTLPKNWPTEGRIEFKNVSLRYNDTGQRSLRNISFCISPLEKIGVVGRTGAGKSSIINALFRLAPVEGKIEIDGVETSELGLHTLRGQMSIIPQEPVLFSGTMKSNLDPFNAFTDERIWNALEQVELKTVVSELPAGLHCPVDAGGSNFSVGQRQLICIARAILHEHNIIILDEATANIDNETDALIQRAIRIQFAKCTIITVAHRLQTIMDSDKVMVMDAGKLVEFDSPFNLLSDKNSAFSKLVEQTGTLTSENLKNLAEKANEKRREAKSL